jgi:hypothetical protein
MDNDHLRFEDIIQENSHVPIQRAGKQDFNFIQKNRIPSPL